MKPSLPNGPRIFPVSAQYRQRFGAKVYKVSVSVARSCPNREGKGGAQVCVFCDQWGSAAYEDMAGLPLAHQIQVQRERIRRRYRAEKFLVYFQAYTNTFASVAALEKWCRTALAERDVVGLVLGTRPDCLPPRILALLARLARETYLSIELGVQTLVDSQLAFLSRGHDAARSLAALETLRDYPEIEVCAHLMFGLPGESDLQLRKTAATLSALGVAGVKLHNLHVLKGTPLEALYHRGVFAPLAREEYARRVGLFLQHLAPAVAVHRLAAVASRWEQVVAPAWVREKMGTSQFMLDYLERHDLRQGAACTPGGETLPRGAGFLVASPSQPFRGSRPAQPGLQPRSPELRSSNLRSSGLPSPQLRRPELRSSKLRSPKLPGLAGEPPWA